MVEHRQGGLGIFLQGGGCHGAWQIGALEALVDAGLEFSAVMGYSIGSLNGAALAFGRLPVALGIWRGLDGWTIRPSVRVSPFSLMSTKPLRDFMSPERDEETAKRTLRSEFTVISYCREEDRVINARFTPAGANGWDGPLVEHTAASCAIPYALPPVDLVYRERRLRLIDPGVCATGSLDLTPLADCADVIVLEMVRADDVGRRYWNPLRALDQTGREIGRKLVDEALADLTKRDRPPRISRLAPSRRLEPMVLDFRRAGVQEMLRLGAADAKEFLAHHKSLASA